MWSVSRLVVDVCGQIVDWKCDCELDGCGQNVYGRRSDQSYISLNSSKSVLVRILLFI